MKVGSACVRALLRRKRCVRHRLAKGVLFVATRVCPLALPARCCSGSRDQLDIDQNRKYISVNGKSNDVGMLAVSQCAGAVPSRAFYVLALKILLKLLSFWR